MEFGVACSSDYFSPALCPLSEALQEPETGLETSCRSSNRNLDRCYSDTPRISVTVTSHFIGGNTTPFSRRAVSAAFLICTQYSFPPVGQE